MWVTDRHIPAWLLRSCDWNVWRPQVWWMKYKVLHCDRSVVLHGSCICQRLSYKYWWQVYSAMHIPKFLLNAMSFVWPTAKIDRGEAFCPTESFFFLIERVWRWWNFWQFSSVMELLTQNCLEKAELFLEFTWTEIFFFPSIRVNKFFLLWLLFLYVCKINKLGCIKILRNERTVVSSKLYDSYAETQVWRSGSIKMLVDEPASEPWNAKFDTLCNGVLISWVLATCELTLLLNDSTIRVWSLLHLVKNLLCNS